MVGNHDQHVFMDQTLVRPGQIVCFYVYMCTTVQLYASVSRGEKELSTEQGLSVRESELPESPGQSSDEEEGKDQRR